jgi:hypothetical protein
MPTWPWSVSGSTSHIDRHDEMAPIGQHQPSDRPETPSSANAACGAAQGDPFTSAITKAEVSERLSRGRPWLLLLAGDLPEQQSAAGFSDGDDAEAPVAAVDVVAGVVRA